MQTFGGTPLCFKKVDLFQTKQLNNIDNPNLFREEALLGSARLFEEKALLLLPSSGWFEEARQAVQASPFFADVQVVLFLKEVSPSAPVYLFFSRTETLLELSGNSW